MPKVGGAIPGQGQVKDWKIDSLTNDVKKNHPFKHPQQTSIFRTVGH